MPEFQETPSGNTSKPPQENQSIPAIATIAPEKPALPTPETNKGNNKTDLLIVFGQGPVKPLLRNEDLDTKKREEWEAFKEDPLHNTEPNFRVLEGDPDENAYLSQLKGLSEEDAQKKMAQWQKLGRFGLNRWGRQNALSAGFALVSGYSERVLLSGGKTMPDWAKAELPPGRLDQWPSEAQLMRDIIIRRFGKMYQEKYGKPIEDAILTEDRSTNTLENYANTVNLNPEVLEKDKANAKGLATDFHVPRTERIAYLFTGNPDIKSDSAQNILKERLRNINGGRRNIFRKKEPEKTVGNKDTYGKILDWMTDPENKDLETRTANEKVFDTALQDPELLTYWLGYIGIAEDPRVLQQTIQRMSLDQTLTPRAIDAFNLAGLNFASLANTNITLLSESQFREIADKLKILTTKEYRKMPVMPKT